jgi:cell wall-associated NlpC family hydrolase
VPFPTRHRRLLALAALALMPLLAQAAPDAAPQADPVARFLGERGLIDTAALKQSPLVQRVRDRASDLVMSAMNFIGVPYRRGGNSEQTGFDCSGFTRHVFDQSLGLLLPRRADEQAHAPGLQSVRRDELKPGDLVFFNTLRRSFSHVGIYIGEGKFIHAPHSGSEVRIEDIHAAYWAKRFTGARRALGLADAANPAQPLPASLVDGGADANSRSAVGLRAPRPE